jgi:hypothetical protein
MPTRTWQQARDRDVAGRTAHRRTRHYAIEDALNRSTDEEGERLLANLQPRPAEVDPEAQSMSFEEAMTDTLVFTSPRGSRSMGCFLLDVPASWQPVVGAPCPGAHY